MSNRTRPPQAATPEPQLRPTLELSGRHVVLGKGPVGASTAALLAGLGAEVVVLSRSGGGPSAGCTHVAVDASDRRSMIEACAGAAVVYNCANPSAYHRWAEEWPPMATALLDAAEHAGAVLVTTSNLYGYGRVDGPVTDDLPLSTEGEKGRIRVAMWNEALARHRAGRVRVTEARAADFYGPRVTDGGHLGTRVLPRLMAGKKVRLLGDPDVPHSFTYVPDVARTLVRLGSDERAWGAAWHVPTAPPLTQRQAIAGLCAAAGVEPVPVGRLPWSLVRASGLAVPMLRELQETRHQLDAPFVLDSSRTTTTFGLEPTSMEDGFGATVGWYRSES
jgi:nucleoside-diphosphate-sugar epimerase